MAEYVFRAGQFVPRPLEEVFAFFARAENLEELTPPWLHFRILEVSPNPIRKGTFIRYRLRWRVFPMGWTSEIIAWEPPHRFIDLQRKGPYRLWHHEHRFEEEAGGTRIFDEVRYELPFDQLGQLVHKLKVRHDVETIFEFRRQAVDRVFGE